MLLGHTAEESRGGNTAVEPVIFKNHGAAALAAVLALERVRRRFSNVSRLILGHQRHSDEVLPTSVRDVSKPTPAMSSEAPARPKR